MDKKLFNKLGLKGTYLGATISMFEKQKKVAVMYSGGVDSSVISALLKALGFEVIPVYFNDDSQYWHTRRKVAITRTLQSIDLFHTGVEMRTYEYEKLRFSTDTFGFMPGLKMIMQLQLMAYCQRYGIETIVTGYNKENVDYPYTFKDELEENIIDMQDMYNRIYDANIKVLSPFDEIDKTGIILLNEQLGKQGAGLKNTYSCKDTRHGGLVHCGKCWGCWSRSSSFEAATDINPFVLDETIYAQKAIKPLTSTMSSVGAVVIGNK